MPGPSKKISLTSLFYLTLKSSEQALQIFMENISDIDVVLGPEHAGHGRKKVHRGNDLNISRVKILVAGGYSADGHGKEVLGFGAKEFISKPYQMKKLLSG